jgi:hypothetical protein
MFQITNLKKVRKVWVMHIFSVHACIPQIHRLGNVFEYIYRYVDMYVYLMDMFVHERT